MAEYGRLALLCGLHDGTQHGGKTVAVKDFIPQHHGAGLARDKFLAQQKRLCRPIRRRLHLVAQEYAELTAIAQQLLKAQRVRWRGDNQQITNTRKNQRGKRIINHGLIVYREKLLTGDHG